MTCKKDGNLTRERYKEHILNGKISNNGHVNGAHTDSSFRNLVGDNNKISEKEIDPPAGI